LSSWSCIPGSSDQDSKMFPMIGPSRTVLCASKTPRLDLARACKACRHLCELSGHSCVTHRRSRHRPPKPRVVCRLALQAQSRTEVCCRQQTWAAKRECRRSSRKRENYGLPSKFGVLAFFNPRLFLTVGQSTTHQPTGSTFTRQDMCFRTVTTRLFSLVPSESHFLRVPE
jgi:hypothetical protein